MLMPGACSRSMKVLLLSCLNRIEWFYQIFEQATFEEALSTVQNARSRALGHSWAALFDLPLSCPGTLVKLIITTCTLLAKHGAHISSELWLDDWPLGANDRCTEIASNGVFRPVLLCWNLFLHIPPVGSKVGNEGICQYCPRECYCPAAQRRRYATLLRHDIAPHAPPGALPCLIGEVVSVLNLGRS